VNEPVRDTETLRIGDRIVHRLGFGAMRITGPGVWGAPDDRNEAIAVLRRAVELGVDFIDTADSYGPTISEELIFEALHPYVDVAIATKAGLLRTGPGRWVSCGRPDYLRQQCELSLRRLGVESLDLFQLHRIDPTVGADEQFSLLRALLDEGKVRAVGLSEVSVSELDAASGVVDISTVQNHYNVTHRVSEPVLAACSARGIGFIAYFPFAAGALAREGSELAKIAAEAGATPAQVALRWLLDKDPVMLPIPGTSTVAHLDENCAAAGVQLSDAQRSALDALAPPA
jgi:pyridoxine 4-dehydrogenase